MEYPLRVNKENVNPPLKVPWLDSTGSLLLPYPHQAPSMQFASPPFISLKITADKCSPPPPLPASRCTCTPSHMYTAPRHCWHFTSSESLSLETYWFKNPSGCLDLCVLLGHSVCGEDGGSEWEVRGCRSLRLTLACWLDWEVKQGSCEMERHWRGKDQTDIENRCIVDFDICSNGQQCV